MNKLATFFRELTLRPQGATIVFAAFLPIIAIVAMGPAVRGIAAHFPNEPNAIARVAAMIGAPGLTMAILAPFAGILVDRFGRKRLLLIATFFYGIFGSIPLLLNDLDHIYYSRLLLGVSEAVILTVVNTLIGDYWDDKGRKNWLFLQGLLGPAISGVISLYVGYATKQQWNSVFFVYLIAFPIWAAMMIWLFEPAKQEAIASQSASAAPKSAFPWAKAGVIAAVTFFSSMLYYVFIINGQLVFAEVGVEDSQAYGALIFIPQQFILLGALLFRLLAMKSPRLQLGAFLLLLGGGLAGMGLATSIPAMIAALIVQQTAAGMAVPTLISWTQGKFGFEHRGRAMGIWTGAFFLAQSLSPVLVHTIKASLGSMQGAFLTAGVFGVGASLFALAALAIGKQARA